MISELFSKRRAILWGIVSLLTVLIFLVVLLAEKDYKKDFTVARGNSYMEGLRIVSKKDGTDSWVITARRADFSKDETLAQMDSITIDMKKEGAVLNSDSGVYNVNTRDLKLEKNIVIHMKDSTISADSLSWNPAGGVLSTEGKVRVQGNKFRIEGEGLTATQDNKVRVTRNVKATFF